METTSENLTTLPDNGIFVFGSNYAGRHGRGAALTAARKFGALYGQGMGMMGRSYGIATKDRHMDVLPIHLIASQIDRFLRFARQRPSLAFYVTRIGCGLSGYSPAQIGPLFGKDVPANVILPQSFWDAMQDAKP